MRVIVASNNAHKIEELSTILSGHHIIPVGKFFPDFDPVEDGNSFLENSMIKAKALRIRLEETPDTYYRVFPGEALPPILADDSGICVDALGGAPGIYSARFGHKETGRKLKPAEQNDILLQKLDGYQSKQRSARYICCMILLFGSRQFYAAQESWEGSIAHTPSSAASGFGYDPIFYLPERNCTAADISSTDKNTLSHRAKAARAVATFFLEYT